MPPNEQKPKKTKSKERQFLHDLSTPVAIALGFIEAALDEGTAKDLPEDQKNRLLKAQKALERVRGMMAQRRAELLSENDDATEPGPSSDRD